MVINKKKETYIYALIDDNNNVRYIGKSDNPDKRYIEHIKYGSKNKKNHKENWINKMLNENRKISIKILETVPYDMWEEKEIYWINKYGLENLVNSTIGGNGRKYNDLMKKDKNLKITPNTHQILKKYCEENSLKIFDFVEKLIIESCTK